MVMCVKEVSVTACPAAHMWLMNRQPVFSPEFGVRKFVARDGVGGKLLAFIFFDAVYDAGNLVGENEAAPGTVILQAVIC
jgi:hypothetical protein